MTSNHGCTRPDVEEIKSAYDHLFHSGLSLSKIKDSALGGRLFESLDDKAAGVPGRSIAWKIFLTGPEPLHAPPEVPPAPRLYSEASRLARSRFTQLLLEKMRAPDGSYEEGFVAPGTDLPPQRTKVGAAPSNLDKNNPLSLHDENPWKEWFAAVDLRKTIAQDVERTFPDIGYFRSPAVQAQLMNILFLYSVMHPDIGYRQGMHELLAPLYYAVDWDSLSKEKAEDADVEPELAELCARKWVAADAWTLFESVMRGVGTWYEWREAPDKPSLVPGHVHLNAPNGQVYVEPYVAPILRACNRIQKELLRSVDPTLWDRIHTAGVEPQIYGIRWLRLLFTREFSMHDAMVLWDGLFAADPSFDLAHWICVAMLIRIRNQLIPSDYSTQLTYLLRYPTPTAPPTTSELHAAPHHATLLLRQAIALQMSPSTSAGASIVLENRTLLNIPIEVPEPPHMPARRMSKPGDAQRRMKSASTTELPGAGSIRNGHVRQQSSQPGLPELIAKGLYDRGEALGINKTFMNAVSEIKRNIPDLTGNLVRTPSASTSYAAYPLLVERPPEERPPWEPRTRFEMERDVAQMRDLQKQMGQSVSWIVDTLLQDEDSAKESPDQIKRIQRRKRDALESLSYVRDVLMGSATIVDEERLYDEEEFKKRREKAQADEQLKKETFGRVKVPERHIAPPPPVQPAPLPAASLSEPRSRSAASRTPSAPPPQSPSGAPFFNSPHVDLPKGIASSLSGPLAGATQSSAIPRAPWNYTNTEFSNGKGPSFTAPSIAAPPRASTTQMRTPPLSQPSSLPSQGHMRQGSREKPPGVGHDPLGVL